MDISTSSPFHAGEQALQQRLGVQEHMATFGQRVIRTQLPEQHRAFYQQLPYLFVGSVDAEDNTWASVLWRHPGFIQSPSPTQLSIATDPLPGDPLGQQLKPSQAIGILGLDLHTRRRNRLSGHIARTHETGFDLEVTQCFGNCPKYIQSRAWPALTDSEVAPPVHRHEINGLGPDERHWIEQSDTFFVASAWLDPEDDRGGVDISHRGGAVGFLRFDEAGRLLIPDYAGNKHFNTLGNFIKNPSAGLLFLDFERGHLLQLTGQVEVLCEDALVSSFAGAERLWRFTLTRGHWLEQAWPSGWASAENSPFLPR